MTIWPACCDRFRLELGRAGEQGFAIIAYRDGDHRAFYVQARPFAPDVLDQLKDLRDGPLGIPLAMDLRIMSCPFCGAELDQLIRKYRDTFDALADELARRFTLIDSASSSGSAG